MYEQCSLAIQQLHDDPICDSVLTGAKFQAYCRANWQDAETEVSVPIQVLLDIVPDAGSVDFGKDLVDLKSDTNAAPRLWQANVFKYGYDLQAALYLDVYTQATQEDRCTFGHIISESVFPFYAEYRRLSEEYLAVGRARYEAALKLYARCLKTGAWPGYRSPLSLFGVALVEPSEFMRTQALENLSAK